MQLKTILPFLLAPLILTACGGGDPRLEAVSQVAASQPCIGCHGDDPSPGTGARIAAEWLSSRHAAADGAGCADCHQPASGHPNQCASCHGGGTPTGYEVTINPDQGGKCYGCHAPGSSRHPLGVGNPHFDSRLVAGKNYSTARYVATERRNRCTACHNPHDNTLLPQHRDWAESGHGDVNGNAWADYDFKSRGTSAAGATAANTTSANCVRCHTATGFIRFVSSGFSDIRPFGSAADKTKEILSCDACHENGNGRAYDYKKRRSVPSAYGYYNYSSAATKKVLTSYRFPDLGLSNLCVPCHAGRGTGELIKEVAKRGENFASVAQITAHHLPSAGVLFGVSGFRFYTSAAKYRNDRFLHDEIGLGNLNGTGSKGPCVACHLNSDRSHSYLPVAWNGDGSVNGILSRTCADCHTGAEAGVPSWTPATLAERKRQADAALAALQQLLVQNNLTASPLVKSNWTLAPIGSTVLGTAIVPGSGGVSASAYTMGAASNYYLLSEDRGYWAHNSLYARRLIYDSIDWLLSKDGQMGNGVAAYLTAHGLTDASAYLLGPDNGRP